MHKIKQITFQPLHGTGPYLQGLNPFTIQNTSLQHKTYNIRHLPFWGDIFIIGIFKLLTWIFKLEKFYFVNLNIQDINLYCEVSNSFCYEIFF